MTHQAQLENRKYRNWVQAGLGLKYTKEGLEPFCDDLVKQQHEKILNKVKTNHNLSSISCGQCDIKSLQPDHVRTQNKQCSLGQTSCNCQHPSGKNTCPKNVCSAIYDEIIELHESRAPYWKNTDVQLWCTEPWAVGKCFINAPGYYAKLKASEFDCSALLHVLRNNLDFSQNAISGTAPFTKVLQYRNDIFHSQSMELEDNEVNVYIDDMIAVLEDQKALFNKKESRAAVQKLRALKSEDFVITNIDESEVRKASMKAINEKEREIEQKLKDATDTFDKKANQIEQLGSDIKTNLDLNRSEIKNDVKQTGNEVKNDLLRTGTELKDNLVFNAKKEITEETTTQKHVIEQTRKELEENIVGKVTKLKNEIDRNVVDAKETITEEETRIKYELEQKGKAFIEQQSKTFNEKLQGFDTVTRRVHVHTNRLMRMAHKYCATRTRRLRNRVSTPAQVRHFIITHSRNRNQNATHAARATLGTRGRPISVTVLNDSELLKLFKEMIEEMNPNELQQRIKLLEKRLSDIESQNEDQSLKYEELKEAFRSDLITYYREEYSTLPLCPTRPVMDMPLDNIYIHCQTYEIKDLLPNEEHINERKATNNDIFQKGKKLVLIADKGCGKTTLVRHKLLVWGESYEPSGDNCESYSDEEISEMRQFDIIIYLDLSKTNQGEPDIMCMIEKEIIDRLSRSSRFKKNSFIEDILHYEKCLIILDSLDKRQNTTAKLQGRAWKHCTFFFITASRKHVEGLSSTKIDKHITTADLDETKTNELISKFLKLDSISHRISNLETNISQIKQIYWENRETSDMNLYRLGELMGSICKWLQGDVDKQQVQQNM